MEEKDLQNNEEVETKVSEVKETKKEKDTGYYLAEVPTAFAKVIAFDGKQVPVEELIIKIANAMKDAGLLK